MKTLPQKCADINTVGAFCECITVEVPLDSAAQEICSRAKSDKKITGEDLTELKMAMMDQEDDACCEC